MSAAWQLRDLESEGNLASLSWHCTWHPVFPALLCVAGADVPGYRSWHHIVLCVLEAAALSFTEAQIAGIALRFALTL